MDSGINRDQRKALAIVFLGFFLLGGCMSFYKPSQSRINGLYHEKIKEWQLRIKEEGWSEGLVDDIVKGTVRLTEYRHEECDRWDTPKEFIRRGFQGDCEDIAIFLMATLKRLEYPYGVRVLAVSAYQQDHALLRVKLPDADWKTYETVHLPLGEIDRLFYRPIVEFDEKDIIYFKKKTS